MNYEELPQEIINELPEYEIHNFSKKTKDYCVMVLSLNEGERILTQLDKMKTLSEQVDIIISDSNSTDGSMEHNRLKNEFNINTLLVIKERGQGIGSAIGFHYGVIAGYKGLVLVDGNNKDSVEDIPNFIEKLEEGYEFVQGSRFMKGGKHMNTPLIRRLALKLLHTPVVSWGARYKFTETACAFRGFSIDFLKDPKAQFFRRVLFGYEMYVYEAVIAGRLKKKIIEIPITRSYPDSGEIPTKIKGVKLHIKLIKNIFRISAGTLNP